MFKRIYPIKLLMLSVHSWSDNVLLKVLTTQRQLDLAVRPYLLTLPGTYISGKVTDCFSLFKICVASKVKLNYVYMQVM